MKSVLLTGGLWYIGSHTCVSFEQSGIRTVLLDNLANSSLETLDAIERIIGRRPVFHNADVRDPVALSRILCSSEIDAVIHFAWLKAVGESVAIPFEYYDNNVRGSLVLLESMENAWIRKIIFSSSATVYEATNPLPFLESGIIGAKSPYWNSKIINELFLRDMASSKDWNTVALRYFNPIGAHESGLIGEKSKGVPNNLLPYALEVALGLRESVSVYGDDYPTPDGTWIRDYIHVCDLAEAHLAAYRYLDMSHKRSGFEVFNVWTGEGTSVLQILEMVQSASRKTIPRKIVWRRPGDIAEMLADTSKIEEIIWWKAKRSVSLAVSSGWNFVNSI